MGTRKTAAPVRSLLSNEPRGKEASLGAGRHRHHRCGGPLWRLFPPGTSADPPPSDLLASALCSPSGPTRFRGGSRGQQFSRKPFWNGPRRGAAARAHGVSPLNRPGAAQQGKREGGAPVRSPGKGPAGEAQWQLPTRVQRFLPAGAPPPARRPFRLNRRPLFLQRQPRFSSSGQRIETNAQRKPSQMRRWQLQPASGAVLTVSVANPQAGQTNVPGTKRPFLRGRSSPAKTARRQPKGVPLRFNFRAVANQVGNPPQCQAQAEASSCC
ncbi:UAP56-interacting factor [Varanus komodoensis]|nr:UAP56-interacting factor [Varanus komodoensis]